MLDAKNLTKSYHGINAVKKISFNAAKGEIFGIVGPDGAGKTTLMKMLAGTIRPDNGEVSICGEKLSKNYYACKTRIAYMPQRFGLYEDLTVEENIYFFAKLFAMSNSEIRNALGPLYSFSRLEPFKNRLAGKLSGGMKQKLGLACALVHKPEVLVLDEPTNGVDPVSRREFWGILYDLLSEGRTIIVSTSYLDEAERCAKVALMNEGTFPVIDNPSHLRKSYSRKMLLIEGDDVSGIEKSLSAKYITIRTGKSLRLFVDSERSIGELKLMFAKKFRSFSIHVASPALEDCFLDIIYRGKK